ncbi:hypothetical protein HFP89_11385 [Wenzhouxiangella sp. XN79A]|uniref:hypothetical protein n=1 Tax=Wenzhouxiangella sp. XN79A TaxID=2724193 RepID=UPI00144A4F9E|nr:hypothetical protein [Wenzhouxiangella sp. XN79A]NKI35764.1 hypothetical protein [Wenzhouxiangella sp. XN79A]
MRITEAQLIRAIYASWDLQQALSALTFLLEECDFEERYSRVDLRKFRCFETTLIISMARPLENSRAGSQLSLRALGIKLNQGHRELLDRIMHLRRKIIAHSDEEEMHFRTSTFPVLDGEYNFPHFQFNEGLHLEKSELLALEQMLRWLLQKMSKFFFQVAQNNPEMLERYKSPHSSEAEGNDA